MIAGWYKRWTPNLRDLASLPTECLARLLLGTLLVCDDPAPKTTGIIIETEAYLGVRDRACHAFGGRKTPRLSVLWSDPGLAYVYSMHTRWLLNITTQPEGVPECVLVRALWPIEGIGAMAERRVHPVHEPPRRIELASLVSGPGRLCQAMGISKRHYGVRLLDEASPLRLVEAADEDLAAAGVIEGAPIASGPRIGVSRAGNDALLPLRFWIQGNPLVSR